MLALLVCGENLSLVALIGIILLIGIVQKNAIMMIDFALDAERTEGLPPEKSIYQACLLRFRPIMMTTMAALLGAFIYFWMCEAVWGRTLGKRLCDLRVVRRDGARLGTGGAFVRNLLRIVDWLPFCYLLGAALVWATPGSRRIGDMAARSAVVRTKLVTVSKLDDGLLAVVPWSAAATSRHAPSPRRL